MSNHFALIIEPNDSLLVPYAHVHKNFITERQSSIQSALAILAQKHPDIVFISASYSISKIIDILDAVKNKSIETLIPVVFVVDLSHKISHIPGTSWGNKLAILSSISSVSEYNSTLDRVFSAQ